MFSDSTSVRGVGVLSATARCMFKSVNVSAGSTGTFVDRESQGRLRRLPGSNPKP